MNHMTKHVGGPFLQWAFDRFWKVNLSVLRVFGDIQSPGLSFLNMAFQSKSSLKRPQVKTGFI